MQKHVAPLCSLYERALAAVGADYSCHPVWEKYIAYESALGAHQKVGDLYGRALQTPLKGLDALLAQCARRPVSLHCLFTCGALMFCWSVIAPYLAISRVDSGRLL